MRGPGEAARVLGQRLDRLFELLGKIPGWAWGVGLLITVVWTYPRRVHASTMFGVTLDGRPTLWLASLVAIVLMLVIVALCAFALRSLLHFLEEERWPRRAVGVEMEDVALARAQLAQDAEHLSGAADTMRTVEGVIENANNTIRLLTAELERLRGTRPDRHDDSQKLADGE
jgi:hypothetical protein